MTMTARLRRWLAYRRALGALVAAAARDSYGVMSQHRYETLRAQAWREAR